MKSSAYPLHQYLPNSHTTLITADDPTIRVKIPEESIVSSIPTPSHFSSSMYVNPLLSEHSSINLPGLLSDASDPVINQIEKKVSDVRTDLSRRVLNKIAQLLEDRLENRITFAELSTAMYSIYEISFPFILPDTHTTFANIIAQIKSKEPVVIPPNGSFSDEDTW